MTKKLNLKKKKRTQKCIYHKCQLRGQNDKKKKTFSLYIVRKIRKK